MENLIKLSSVVMLFSFAFSHAQEVVRKDTLSGTELTFSASKKISDLMDKMEGDCADKFSDKNREGTHAASVPAKVVVPSRKLTTAEICQQNPRIMGYKIQLTVVKSNKEANEVKAYFRRRFPSIKAETDASLRPNYKILVGSYFTKQSAASDLKRIREYFKSAGIVQYYIFCAEAK